MILTQFFKLDFSSVDYHAQQLLQSVHFDSLLTQTFKNTVSRVPVLSTTNTLATLSKPLYCGSYQNTAPLVMGGRV